MNKQFTVKRILTVGIVAVVVWLVIFNSRALSGTSINVSLSNGTLDDGLIAHWTFDGKDMVSNVADRSDTGNDGSLMGQTSTTTIQGVLGQALELDGTDDYISIGDFHPTDGTTNDFTASFWVRLTNISTNDKSLFGDKTTTATPGFFTAVCRAGDFQGCDAIHDGKIQFLIRDTGGSQGNTYSGVTVNDGIWHHVVLRWNRGSNGEIIVDLVNGGEVTDAWTDVDDAGATDDFEIGRRNSGVRYFDGDMDDLRIYNRGLSDEEVGRLYDLGATSKINTSFSKGGLSQGLVGHWTFDGTDMVSNVADRSGNNNDGNLTGQTPTTTVAGKIGQGLFFDSVDDEVDAGSNASLSIAGDVSVSAWVSFSSDNDAVEQIIGFGGSGESQAANHLYFFGAIGSTDAWDIRYVHERASGSNELKDFDTNLLDNKFYHLVITRNISTNIVTLYVDGSSFDTLNYGIDPDGGSSGRLDMGSQQGQSNHFGGILDDARVYNRELSAEEVQRLYDLGATSKINTSFSKGGLSQGLVGHWTFDGADMISNVADISGQGNSGSLIGQTSTTSVRGVIGQALELDFVNDYVKILDSSSLNHGTADFTYSIWMKPPDIAQRQGLMSKRRNSDPFEQITIYAGCTVTGSGTCNASKKMGFFVNQNTSNRMWFYTTDDVIDGEWHLITLVRDGTLSKKVYVDGVEVSVTTVSALGNPNTDNNWALRLGWDGNTRYFEGPVDDARVYNRALSAEEVMRLYTIGR